jgi:hypothetical protein
MERRLGAGEERLATTKHDGAEVEPILIDKTGLGQALRQDRSGDVNLASQLGLQPAYHVLEVIGDKRGVGAEGLESISRMTIIKTSTSYFACASPATTAASLSSIWCQPST